MDKDPKPDSGTQRYAAFISYSHSDDEVADWLHKRLENYRIPKGVTAGGRARIGKVFRDRAELASSHDLGGDIRRALDLSDALILLCSPRAARSPYVEEEIRRFKETGKGEQIFAVIIDGEPHAAGKLGRSADEECFPRGLLFQVGPDGAFTTVPELKEPIAADVRSGKDGRENGALKIIAGLLEVGLDDLVQREKHAERRRRLRANAIAAAMSVLALGALAGGAFAWWSQGLAETRRQEAETQTARALQQVSNTIARESRKVFDAESGDHTSSLLLALYADPAARSSDIPEGLAPEGGYELARARLVAAYDHNRLEKILTASVIGIRTSYSSVVSAVAYSPDGRFVVSGMGTGVVNVWDAASGNLVRTLPGYTKAIMSVSFSADGSIAVISSYDGPPRIWDPATWTEIRRLSGDEGGGTSAVSPDGRFVVGAVTAGDVRDHVARIWEVSTGKVLKTLPGHSYPINDIAFTPDGARVATGSNDETVRIWSVETGKELQQFKIDNHVNSVAFSPDGMFLAAGDLGGVSRVWEVETGELKTILHGHSNTVTSIAFASDGNTIMTGALDGLTRIWDINTRSWEGERGMSLRLFAEAEGHVSSAAYSADGQHVATGYYEGPVRIWNVGPAPEISLLPLQTAQYESMDKAFLAPDWRRMVIDSHRNPSNIRDGSSGEVVGALEGQTEALDSASFSADSRLLVAPAGEHAARIWEVASGKLLQTFSGHSESVNSAALSVDGRFVATGSEDGTARIWDAASGKSLHTLVFGPEVDGVFSVAFAPDGRTLATGAYETEVRLWDTASGKLLRKMPGHEGTVITVSYSRDGRFLVTGSSDKSVRIWDASTGAVVRRLLGHGDMINVALFSPDGKYVMSRSTDNVIKFWDVATGNALATLSERDARFASIAFSLDQKHVAVGASSAGVSIWTIPEIITEPAPGQVKAACEMLWRANAPLAFRKIDIATHGVLEGQAADPDHPEILTSPCRGVLPQEAFDPATAKDGWMRIREAEPATAVAASSRP